MTDRTILWRRLDRAGHESARLRACDGGHEVAGTAILVESDLPCRLDYAVRCDGAWRTTEARVSGWIGTRRIEVSIEADAAGRWRLGGVECPQVAGCLDVDLNFSPATNLLPIRRLRLAVGAAAPVRAAWLRFPGFTLEPLEQIYRRLDATTYRYESGGGVFVADLEVNDAGLVTRYPGFCAADAAA